jgi:hypothetical protein
MTTPASHALTLHTTNSEGYVAVCACGWWGAVRVAEAYGGHARGRRERAHQRAREVAADEWGEHVRAAKARRDAARGERLVAIVRQPGRWSHA